MRKDPVRFTSQWVLIGVILFYTVGTALIARHTKKIFVPASAGGSEYSQYSSISEKPNQLEPLTGQRWQNNTTVMTQWDSDESNLTLYDVAFGTEQFYQNGDTNEPSDDSNNEQITDDTDTDKKDAPQELTKIRTKIKCIETILKKATIKPYSVNGQIKGLQINGLDKISEAKALLLKSGDIILAVNGQTLSSKRGAYDIFKKARKEPIMIIDLLRDGESKKFLLDFTSVPLLNLLK
jgi:C-terminal processing protease CtpA/Prc